MQRQIPLQFQLKKMWRLVVLVLILGILQIHADCNICSSITNAACVSSTQFQFCVNNIPSGTLNSCPSGNYCTGEAQICQTNASLLACTGCGQCNSDNSFACLGVRTFALCLGDVNPSAITGSCAPDHVCNWDNPNICGTAEQGYQATCPLVDDEESTTTSTTAAPSGNVTPNVYCNQVLEVGRFPYGTDQGTSCKK